MIDNTTWDQVADRLVETDFYQRDHQLIFRSIFELANQESPFDILTISDWMGDRLVDAGGFAYLATISNDTPSAANIRFYANIVRKYATLRALISAGGAIVDSANSPNNREVTSLIDFAEQQIFAIAERDSNNSSGFKSIHELAVQVMDRTEQLFQRSNPITGISTGFVDLDDITTGLQPSDLIIVAGRPSMGKTALAMGIAEHAITQERKTVAVFSMEMSGEQLAVRMLSSLGRIDQQRMRTGRLEEEDWGRLASAITILSETHLFIDDTPAMTHAELRARCRKLKREKGLDLVVIDYLQLMQVDGKENRATQVAELSRGLKILARELQIPVLVLSQLNRGLEQRPNKRPIMSDLRDSGGLEQDADLILFIYRDEVYNEDSLDKGTAEIIIGKHRNGPIGMVRLAFLGKYARFENFLPS